MPSSRSPSTATPLFASGLLLLLGVARAEATPLFDAGTGHYYEFVAGSMSWHAAKSAAESMTYLGMTGYLVTITTAQEDAFIAFSFDFNQIWMGASDEVTEGSWTWMTGPEAGVVFSIGNVVQPGYYANWQGTEPNNGNAGEDYGEIIKPGGLRWNDRPDNPAPETSGFIVEYGTTPVTPVPEPSSLLLSGAVFAASSLRAWKRRAANITRQ